MADRKTLLALFGDVDPAANGIEKLHELGVQDDDINVVSGIPIKGAILGRPGTWTNVPRIAMFGAVLGLSVAVFLMYGIPAIYPLYVGGQPLLPIPPGFIIGFELTMLGLMGFAFIGLFIESRFPSFESVQYVPEVSDGKIAVFFHCPPEAEKNITEALTKAGVEYVRPAEDHKL